MDYEDINSETPETPETPLSETPPFASPHYNLYQQELSELKWLQDHPDFNMRPATIREFIGPKYLNEDNIRPGVMDALDKIFGDHVDTYSISPCRRAVFSGAVGVGKTTLASVSIAYMVHWVSCLKDPQNYFGLMTDSPISFMLMSTSLKQANAVIYSAIKARINNSPWFKNSCRVINPKIVTYMEFPNKIFIIPGSSSENSFEGHNILGGVIDEGDSHKVTLEKDFAEAGFSTIDSRIASRFTDFARSTTRGLIIVIGQMKRKSGFMARKYNKFADDPEAVAVKMSIWESFGWHNFTEDKGDINRGIETSPRDSFFFDVQKKRIYTKEAAKYIMNKDIIEVPMTYIKQFDDDPVKALRDLGGIPPETDDPFIPQTDRILDCQNAWMEKFGEDNPISDNLVLHEIKLRKKLIPKNSYKRVIHIDTAFSANGDALGFAMGRIEEKILFLDEEQPIFDFDLLMRIKARTGTQIDFSEVRKFIYRLTSIGYDIDRITLDGFNSVDFIQTLRKKHYKSEYLSVDRSKYPYENLRESINEGRCRFPLYMTLINHGDTKYVNMPYKELSELTDTGKKIDHSPTGSKDLADAMAGVVYTLTNNPRYVREAKTIESNDFKDKERILTEHTVQSANGIDMSDLTVNVVDFETFTSHQEEFLVSSNLALDYNTSTTDVMKQCFGETERIY